MFVSPVLLFAGILFSITNTGERLLSNEGWGLNVIFIKKSISTKCLSDLVSDTNTKTIPWCSNGFETKI